MSFLVVLYPQASTGFCHPALDCRCRYLEDCTTVASHLPSRVPLLVFAYILQEGEAVYLLPGEVLKVLCVCHVKIMLIVLPAPALRLRRGFGRFLPYRRLRCCCRQGNTAYLIPLPTFYSPCLSLVFCKHRIRQMMSVVKHYLFHNISIL